MKILFDKDTEINGLPSSVANNSLSSANKQSSMANSPSCLIVSGESQRYCVSLCLIVIDNLLLLAHYCYSFNHATNSRTQATLSFELLIKVFMIVCICIFVEEIW